MEAWEVAEGERERGKERAGLRPRSADFHTRALATLKRSSLLNAREYKFIPSCCFLVSVYVVAFIVL